MTARRGLLPIFTRTLMLLGVLTAQGTFAQTKSSTLPTTITVRYLKEGITFSGVLPSSALGKKATTSLQITIGKHVFLTTPAIRKGKRVAKRLPLALLTGKRRVRAQFVSHLAGGTISQSPKITINSVLIDSLFKEELPPTSPTPAPTVTQQPVQPTPQPSPNNSPVITTPKPQPTPWSVASLSLVGTNAEPIVATLYSDGAAQCSIDPTLNATRIDACRFSIRPTNLRAAQVTGSYSVTLGNQTANGVLSLRWTQTGEFGGDYQSLNPYREKLTRTEAIHLAKNATMGRDMDEIIRLATTVSLDAAVEHILTPKTSSQCRAIQQQAQEIARSYYINATFTRSGTDSTGKTVSITYSTPNTPEGKFKVTMAALQHYWLHMMRYGCDGLRERMALFLANHFSVNLEVLNFTGSEIRDLFAQEHFDLLRGSDQTGKLPNFAEIVGKMHGVDGAMLSWLNNDQNAYGRTTNENYARELLELFLLGSRDILTNTLNYTERDIYELSFALTGYTYTQVPDSRAAGMSMCCDLTKPGCTTENQCLPATKCITTFVPARWNDVQRPRRSMLFEGTPWERYEAFKAEGFTAGGDTLTPYLMYQHPGVARYLATKLIATFASLAPTEQMVSSVAKLLTDNSYDFVPALRAILTSSAMFSKEATTDCVAAPVEQTMFIINALELPLTGTGTSAHAVRHSFLNAVSLQGQRLLAPPTVFGWQECGKITGNKIHDGSIFALTTSAFERDRGFVSYLNEVEKIRTSTSSVFSWNTVLTRLGVTGRDPGSLIDSMASRLGISLSAPQRSAILDYLTTIPLKVSATPKTGELIDPTAKQSISVSNLSDTQFTNYLAFKMPGLVRIFAGLSSTNVR